MVRKAEEKDIKALAKLASEPEVWSDSPEELEKDFAELIRSEKDLVAVSEENGEVIAFANVRIRSDYVAGASALPAAYLEGICVKEGHRGRGEAKKLLAYCENWAGERGCSDFGSDCLIDNEASRAFHLAMGFREVERVICFAKKLGERE